MNTEGSREMLCVDAINDFTRGLITFQEVVNIVVELKPVSSSTYTDLILSIKELQGDSKEVTRNDLKTEGGKGDKMCLVPIYLIESLEKVRDQLLDYYPEKEFLYTVATIPFIDMTNITQGLYEVYGRNYKVIPK